MAETMPRTAQEALALWDKGEPVPAFEVESEGASQETLWGAAFELIRRAWTADGMNVQFGEEGVKWAFNTVASLPVELTRRERDVVASIVMVAAKDGWSKMVAGHVHAKSPALMIRKAQ